jgi:hypothetical protein
MISSHQFAFEWSCKRRRVDQAGVGKLAPGDVAASQSGNEIALHHPPEIRIRMRAIY